MGGLETRDSRPSFCTCPIGGQNKGGPILLGNRQQGDFAIELDKLPQ